MKKLSIVFLSLLIVLAGCTDKKPVVNQNGNDIENNQEQEKEEDQEQGEDSRDIRDEYKKISPLTMKADNSNESLENMYNWHLGKPYFEGFENEETARFVNDRLSKAVDEYEKANDFIKNPTEGETRHLSYSFNVEPKLLFNDNGVLSLAFESSQYTGGAHGLYWSDFYNFDILNSAEIELKDLFKDDIDYKELVYDYLFEQVKDDDLITENLKNYYDNNQELIFFIQENKINVYFGVYALGPYAAGEMTIDIPKKVVENKLSTIGEIIYSED